MRDRWGGNGGQDEVEIRSTYLPLSTLHFKSNVTRCRLNRVRLLERLSHDGEKRNLSISQRAMKLLPGEGEH